MIRIRFGKEDDYSIIHNLCEQRFGQGYLDYEEFSHWLEYPELFLVAEYQGKFAGFVCHLPESIEDLAAGLQLSPEYVSKVSGGKPVIHCKSAVLCPDYENLGIMQELVATVNENSVKLGFGAAFAPAWKYKDKVPMGNILKSLGFVEIAEKENLWYDMENYTCVICGGRCHCSAVIFQKVL